MSDVEYDEVYSNAFNFSSFLLGGVDPRTGIYSCTLSLGEITSHALNGPSLPINFHFNPLNPLDCGFGKGWTLACTRYDRAAKCLTLVSGETSKTLELPDEVQLVDQKIERFRLVKTDENRFILSTVSGQREELSRVGQSSVAVSQRIWAANGARLDLEYTLFNGRPMLAAVRDSQRTLLSITRTGAGVQLKRYPNSDQEASFDIRFTNNRIVSITLPCAGRWDIGYQVIDGLTYVSRIFSPMGAVERVSYKKSGLRFPAGAGRAAMASVAAYTVFPGNGQPAIHKRYSFSDQNFLGFGAPGVSASTASDALYKLAGDYNYTSCETLLRDSNVYQETVRTYNKFHLLVSEVRRSGAKITSQLFDYYYEPGKSFEEQPAQCCLPKRSVMRYDDAISKRSREDVTQFEYDNFGNEIRRVEPGGLTTLTEYFATEGGIDCPPDPLAFVRFPRQRTEFNPADSKSGSSITRYRYASSPLLEGYSIASIVPVREQFYLRDEQAEHLYEQIDYEYVNAPQAPDVHGRLLAKTSTLNALATRQTYTYSVNNLTVSVKTVLTAHDAKSAASTVVYAALTGNCLMTQEEGKAPVSYEYDALGRVTRETVSQGTAYAAHTVRVYQLPQAESQYPTLWVTEVNGMQQQVTYDGIGRVCTLEEEEEVDGSASGIPLRVVKANMYNSSGQLQSETATDWLNGAPLAQRTRYEYDEWGQVKSIQGPDGLHDYIEREQERLCETRWKQGHGKTVTFFNERGKPVSVELFDLEGVSQAKITHVYDGFDRCTQQIDPAGNVTSFRYDAFGRLSRSTLPDGNVVETRYASFSHDALPVEIRVAGKTLGSQTFDGLGRLTSAVTGGREVKREYVGSGLAPTAIIQPDGRRVTHQYEPLLDGLLTRRTQADQISNYAYYPRSGLMSECSEQGRVGTFRYSRAGWLTYERWALPGHAYETTNRYSLGGRVLSHVDVKGEEHRYEYDATGRVKSFRHTSLNAEFTYNTLGQLHVMRATDASSQQLKTTLSYDALAREVQRVIELVGSESYTLTTRYTKASKVAQRTLVGANDMLRDENFSYDSRGRLETYQCSGTHRPLDVFGKEIVGQRFTFDAFDNIVSLETQFPGGVNTTIYTMSERDPTQLISIQHSHPDYPAAITLHYDDNGKLLIDTQGRSLGYDGLGRLSEVSVAVSSVIRRYGYDARDRLLEMTDNEQTSTHLFYRNDAVSSEVRGPDAATFFRLGDVLLGQGLRGSLDQTVLLGVDHQNTVLAEAVPLRAVTYTPYGARTAQDGLQSLLGLNNERFDSITGCYLLGNGYRAYDPLLMRFQSPDSLSPFGEGGLNPYVYCLGDPINRSDPTGHSSWQAWLGVGLAVFGILASILSFGAATPLAITGLVAGVASGVAGIAGAAAQELFPNSGAGDVLGYVSLGLGLLSLGAGLAASTKAFSQWGNRMNDAFKQGLSGRGGAKAANRMAKLKPVEEESSVTWKLIRPKPRNINPDLSDSAKRDYNVFTDAIEKESLHPRSAAKRIGESKYGKLGGTSNQYKVRIGGKDRVTFLLHKASVEILQVGGHT